MSAQATAWAWNQDVPQNAKLLLLLLADSADQHGHGPPATLEDASMTCGFDNQTLQKHLQKLQDQGLLEVEDNKGYALKIPPPKHSAFRFSRTD